MENSLWKKDDEENMNGEVIKVGIGEPKDVNAYVKSIKVEGVEVEKPTITLPVAVLDTELQTLPENKLIISIGGPCVNEVTKEFLAGTPYGSCQTWPLKPGQALIEYAKKGNTVALIIAGTTGEDTRKAVQWFVEGLAKEGENDFNASAEGEATTMSSSQ